MSRLSFTLLVAQTVKNLSAMWETWVRPLGWEDPLEEGLVTHSNILGLENLHGQRSPELDITEVTKQYIYI